jgi:hypothetical protein
MLILMHQLKQAKKLVTLTISTSLLAACGIATPVSAIPLPTNTSTVTLEPGIPPECMIHDEDGKHYVLSDQEFFGFGPSETKLDEVLVGNHPEWANFEQTVSWYAEPVKVGKLIEAASFREQYSFNPAITLVTLGESLDWQIRADGDLYSRALQTSEALIRPALDWINPENEQLRAQHPQIANAATYALYIFFGQDETQLQAWCNTYQQLFGTSP